MDPFWLVSLLLNPSSEFLCLRLFDKSTITSLNVLKNEHDLQKHIDYIHYNPVKPGYVKRPVDWKYSSIHQYIKSDILPMDWTCSDIANLYQD